MALTVTAAQVKPLAGAIVRTITLAEAATAGQGMYPNASGAYLKADADAAGKYRATCILIADNQGNGNTGASYASGSEVSMVCFGPVSGFSGMDPSLSVWAGTTAGGFTQTKPSGALTFAAPIGYPLDANTLFVSPQPFDTTY